jgi:primosomal protein N' (replication factor Y)
MPPYGRLAAIIIESLNEQRARAVSRQLMKSAPIDEHVLVLGPAPAPIYKLRNKFRFRFLLQAPKKYAIQRFINTWLAVNDIPSNVQVKVDIDPYSFL